MGFHSPSPLPLPHLLHCRALHLHGRQAVSFVNGSVAVSGYRRSSGPGRSAPWYCTISLDHCAAQLASSKSHDLVLVLPPSYFYLIGHNPPSTHSVLVPWLGYSLTTAPGPLGRFAVRLPFTSPPLRMHGLSRPNPPHLVPSVPRSGHYGPSTITLEYGCGSVMFAVRDR